MYSHLHSISFAPQQEEAYVAQLSTSPALQSNFMEHSQLAFFPSFSTPTPPSFERPNDSAELDSILAAQHLWTSIVVGSCVQALDPDTQSHSSKEHRQSEGASHRPIMMSHGSWPEERMHEW